MALTAPDAIHVSRALRWRCDLGVPQSRGKNVCAAWFRIVFGPWAPNLFVALPSLVRTRETPEIRSRTWALMKLGRPTRWGTRDFDSSLCYFMNLLMAVAVCLRFAGANLCGGFLRVHTGGSSSRERPGRRYNARQPYIKGSGMLKNPDICGRTAFLSATLAANSRVLVPFRDGMGPGPPRPAGGFIGIYKSAAW